MFDKPVYLYGCVHFGKSLLWHFFNTFFLIYAVYSIDLPPFYAGLLVFLFYIVDAVIDFYLASWMQKKCNEIKLFLWITAFSALCSLSTIAVFSFFGSVSKTENVPLTFILCIIFRFSFSCIDVPLNTVMSLINVNSRQFNNIAASRSISSTLSKISIAIVVFLFAETNLQLVTEHLWKVAICIGVSAFLILVIAFAKLEKFILVSGKRGKSKEYSTLPLKNQSLSYYNSNIIHLYLINFSILTLCSQVAGVLIFFTDQNESLSISFTLTWQWITIVSALSVIFWTNLASKSSKKRSLILCSFMSLFSIPLLLIGYDNIQLFIFTITLYAAFFHCNTLVWSLLPDATRSINLTFNGELNYIIVGYFGASGKIMIGVGVLISGGVVELSGFPSNSDIKFLAQLVVSLAMFGLLFIIAICSTMNSSD